MKGFERIFSFAGSEIQGKRATIAPASAHRSATSLFREEVARCRGQQERAKPAAFAVGDPQCFLFEQLSEKLLRQIARVVGIDAASANESVQWIPVDLRTTRQLPDLIRPGRFSRGVDHHAPLRVVRNLTRLNGGRGTIFRKGSRIPAR